MGFQNTSSSSISSDNDDNSIQDSGSESGDQEISLDNNIKGKYGVWIGNLSFDTNRKDLIDFLKNTCEIESIKRINLPMKNPKSNKGFAYVDFESNEDVKKAISRSESTLKNRSLLIKSSNDFKGRPKKLQSKEKAQPTLFIGNLSFETLPDHLDKIFREMGNLKKIRVATFQDNPNKCKGFALVDFEDIESSMNVMKKCIKKPIYCNNRKLRIEYASEEATKRGQGKRKSKIPKENPSRRIKSDYEFQRPSPSINETTIPIEINPENSEEIKRKGFLVAFQGQKIKFDE